LYTSEKLILNSSRLVTFKLDIADVIHATWTRDFYSNRTDIFHGDTANPEERTRSVTSLMVAARVVHADIHEIHIRNRMRRRRDASLRDQDK